MEHNFDLQLNRYFDGDLNESEKEQFLQELEINPKLKEDFLAHKLCTEAFQVLADESLRAQLKNAEAAMESKSSNWMKSVYTKWTAVASVLIILASIFFFTPKQVDHKTLFSQNFKAYENLYSLNLRSNTPHKDKEIKVIMDYYENGDFASATRLFESEKNLHKNNIDLQFYMGIAYLGMSNTERAIELLSNIPTNSKYTAISQWYLGLSYLLDEQYQQARNLLMRVEYNQQEAQKIIQEMKPN